jgi:hypothetical protein
MAGIQYLGQVGATGTATGPHKHLYVKDLASGKYLDPATIRTPLLGLRVGENRLPALIKDEKGNIKFNPEAGITLTSKFGPRSAPTAGASTYHQGEDWALPEGTPIYYEGGGTFKPLANQGGYGNLATLVTGDNKYEIGIGHMKSLGQASSLPSSPEQPKTADPSDFGTLLKGFLLGAASNQQPTESAETKVKREMIGSLMKPSASPDLFNMLLSPQYNPYLG